MHVPVGFQPHARGQQAAGQRAGSAGAREQLREAMARETDAGVLAEYAAEEAGA